MGMENRPCADRFDAVPPAWRNTVVRGDVIRIEDLAIQAFHGVLPEEKRLGQRFLLTIDMELDLKPAGRTDDLSRSVSYAEVAQSVSSRFAAQSRDLIETAAEDAARHILLQWPLVRCVRVCVKKPWAPVGLPLETVSVAVTRAWHRAHVAIGSNLGDSEATCRAALAELESEDLHVRKVSSFHRTTPVGYVDQPAFLNGAFEVETLLDPWELLARLLDTETAHGRKREIRWGPRTLDLDLLLYDHEVLEHPDLVVPHPRMLERKFVLAPLAEIAPWVVHPLAGCRIADALAALGEP